LLQLPLLRALPPRLLLQGCGRCQVLLRAVSMVHVQALLLLLLQVGRRV
jgi:hypothetical protein